VRLPGSFKDCRATEEKKRRLSGLEKHTQFAVKEMRSGSAWFKTGICKLRWMRKGFEKGRCPMCGEEEDALHILLKCSETRNWRKIVLSKWLSVNEEVAYKRIINCTML
jgi:hypothetical protein